MGVPPAIPSPCLAASRRLPPMRTPFVLCLAATALVAQSGSRIDEPRLPSLAGSIAPAQLPRSNTIDRCAIDTECKSADTVVAQFRQGNQPPVVKAGPDINIVITSSAHLAGAAEDDGLPGRMLAVHWNLLAGPGTATFAAATQPATDVSFSVAGSYTLELSAFDGDVTSSDTVVVTVQDLPVTLERTITSGNDDVEQGPVKVDRSSRFLEMGTDGAVSQVVGLRFQDVAIPRGAVIWSAHLQFTSERTATIPTQLRICGEASDNAAPFNPAHSILSRPATNAAVFWAPAAWRIVQEAGADQRSPNLKSIVQEITSRPGWSAGNSMVLEITGTGSRTATSYEKKPTAAAKLIVTYRQ